MNKVIYFAHGKESGPWGTKIRVLANIAKQFGFKVTSVDYRGIDDPYQRAEKLVAEFKPGQKSVLVGSSMGAAVSILASEQIQPDGLFVLAPAVLMPGYEKASIKPNAKRTQVVHGWHDDIVPVENAVNYSREHQLPLLLLDDGHNLVATLPEIEKQFRLFLKSVISE